MFYSDFPGLQLLHRGKVRDMYAIPENDNQLLMVASDRISAYDVIMDQPIPGKGTVLTKLSLFWFKLLSDIVENHLITADVSKYPPSCQPYAAELEGRSMLVKKATPLPIECIVRGYSSGSFWSAFKKAPMETGLDGEFKWVNGFKIPGNILESGKFAEPFFTPSTKAALGEHDENISLDQMTGIIKKWLREKGINDKPFALANQIGKVSAELYQRAAAYALSKGIIIADTKFELALLNGRLILIDEVLTPDSSRFWPLEQYKPGASQPSFDKQFLRDYLSGLTWDENPPAPPLPGDIVEKTRQRYEEALIRITA